MTRPRVTDVHPPPWTHRTSRTPTGVWHDLVDADGATIYSGPDGDHVLAACQHATTETGISPV